MGERTFQREGVACVRSLRLKKGRNFRKARTTDLPATKRRGGTGQGGGEAPGPVSHIPVFYLLGTESL